MPYACSPGDNVMGMKPGNKKGKSSESGWNRNLLAQAMLIVLCFVVTFLVALDVRETVPLYSVGTIAPKDIKAKKDFLVQDPEATQRNKEKALSHAPLVFDVDTDAAERAVTGIHKVFEIMREAQNTIAKQEVLAELPRKIAEADLTAAEEEQFGGGEEKGIQVDLLFDVFNIPLVPAKLQKPSKPNVSRTFKEKLISQLEEALGTQVFPEVLDQMLEMPVNKEVEKTLSDLVANVLKGGVVVSKSFYFKSDTRPVIFKEVPSGKEYGVEDVFSIKTTENAKKELKERITDKIGYVGEKFIKVYNFIADQFLQPNITFNRYETENRKDAILTHVRPVFYKIKKGEIIVAKGDKVTPEQYRQLLTMRKMLNGNRQLINIVGVFLVSMIIVWIVTFVAINHVKVFPKETRDFLFLLILMSMFLVGIRMYDFISEALEKSFPFVQSEGMLFSYPLCAAAMIVSIIFNVETALVISLLLSLLAGIVLGNNFGLFFYFLVGSFVAARGVANCKDRITPVKAGFLVGLINAVIAGVFTLMNEQVTISIASTNLLFAVLGGLLGGVITTGLTPLAEIVFQYTTDVKLLELANLDQPLLRELMIQAPGTYHHSIIVGNMVEAAARSINANSLLGRVAAYYHDIGKIRKPLYFVENQKDGENKHEKLAPSMSSLILISHVKDGVDLARKHNLGKPIIDIIQQHHGTSLISFFYQKAIKLREKAEANKGSELPPVNIENYRYPGPKPQTKEAGLVMLADCVEAASRTLTEPTPAKIQGLVHRVINKIFTDGELDECELTLKDLHQIAQQFNKILSGIYHRRIEYPEQAGAEGAKERVNGDTDKRSGRNGRDSQPRVGEKGKENIKRLGLYRG